MDGRALERMGAPTGAPAFQPAREAKGRMGAPTFGRADFLAGTGSQGAYGSAGFPAGIVDARRASTQPQQPPTPTSISTSKPSATAPELS